MEVLLLVSLACAGISFTITTTSVFKWLRNFISKAGSTAEEWIHCPWCLNHYISLIAWLWLPRYSFDSISAWPTLGLLWLSTVTIGGLVHYALLRAYKPTAEAEARRKIDQLNKQ